MGALLTGSATAQDEADDGTGLDPSLPIPTLKYDRPPASFSWDISLQGSFGEITYWKDEVQPWIGVGLRFSWGKNFTETGAHRIGLSVQLFLEGPAPVHMTTGLEPMLAWDYIAPSGFWVGLGAGVGALYHVKAISQANSSANTSTPGFGLAGAARLGYSQTFSRIGRRLFIGVEPKVRWMDGRVGLLAQLMVGSGQGY